MGLVKFSWGGGEAAAHSTVVASQGLSFSIFFPFFQLIAILIKNGICAIASAQAHDDISTFKGCVTLPCAYTVWSYKRRETPVIPMNNIGMKIPLMKRIEDQK